MELAQNCYRIKPMNWMQYLFVTEARKLIFITKNSANIFSERLPRYIFHRFASIGVGHDMCAIIKIWQQEVMILSHG
jgi:hypothetical protein